MKVMKDPLFVAVILAGISVGAGVFVAGAKYPEAGAALLVAWLVLAAVAAYGLTKRRHRG